jgi:AraC-like DNA-binding protein
VVARVIDVRTARQSDVVPALTPAATFFRAVLEGLEREGGTREELAAFGTRAAEMIGEALARTLRHFRLEGGSDLTLILALARHAAEVASRHEVSATQPLGAVLFLERARKATLDAIAAGEPSLAAVARHLGASPRTVQRRLRRAGTRFEAVLDPLRRELALRHLADEAVGIDEVAARVGFSEPSAFYRAFRRWTGTSPRAYRAAR